MHFNLLPLFTLALASLGTASPAPNNQTTLGHAIVANECPHPIYLWSVSSTISSQQTIEPLENHTEPFRHDLLTGGVSLKITTVRDGLYSSSPQTIFAYNLVDRLVWFDLSDVFGDPFRGNSVSLLPSEPEIRWEDGVPPAGSQVRVADAGKDLVLTLC